MKLIVAILFFLLSFLCAIAQNTTSEKLVASVTETSLKINLNIIAGKRFEGRMTASKGDSLAIHYISNWFDIHHLSKPYRTATPYLQDVSLARSDFSRSALTIDGKVFDLDRQWTYFNGSNSFSITSAEVVFIGYGLSTAGFDELKDADIEGKIVVFAFDFPNESNGKKIIYEKDMPNEEQHIKSILSKKPLAVLIYDTDFEEDLKGNKFFRNFEPFHDYSSYDGPQFNTCLVSPDIGNYLVGGNIDSIYRLILQTAQPHSFNTHKKITLSITKNEEHKNTDNIVGIIKGTDENLPCVVFTAHHDHFGKINGSTYYGADDNGSGTTALLEISKILGDASAGGIRPKRTIVFVSTAAEEQGLIGSYAYVKNPAIPLSETYCDINIDMLGRVDSFYAGKRTDSNYVYFMYRDSSKNLFNRKKLQEINQKYSGLKLDTLYDRQSKKLNPYGLIARSDNFPFMQKGIPAIWFFSGFHKDYHQPTDTPDKINYPLFKRRTQLVLATLWQLANE
jgi:hypothetical protein